jgi:hypothetical protein
MRVFIAAAHDSTRPAGGWRWRDAPAAEPFFDPRAVLSFFNSQLKFLKPLRSPFAARSSRG